MCINKYISKYNFEQTKIMVICHDFSFLFFLVIYLKFLTLLTNLLQHIRMDMRES